MGVHLYTYLIGLINYMRAKGGRGEDPDHPLPRSRSYCWRKKIRDRPAKSSKGEGRSPSRNMLTPSFMDIAEHPLGINLSIPRVPLLTLVQKISLGVSDARPYPYQTPQLHPPPHPLPLRSQPPSLVSHPWSYRCLSSSFFRGLC
jgi:hypothetical protein